MERIAQTNPTIMTITIQATITHTLTVSIITLTLIDVSSVEQIAPNVITIPLAQNALSPLESSKAERKVSQQNSCKNSWAINVPLLILDVLTAPSLTKKNRYVPHVLEGAPPVMRMGHVLRNVTRLVKTVWLMLAGVYLVQRASPYSKGGSMIPIIMQVVLIILIHLLTTMTTTTTDTLLMFRHA